MNPDNNLAGAPVAAPQNNIPDDVVSELPMNNNSFEDVTGPVAGGPVDPAGASVPPPGAPPTTVMPSDPAPATGPEPVDIYAQLPNEAASDAAAAQPSDALVPPSADPLQAGNPPAPDPTPLPVETPLPDATPPPPPPPMPEPDPTQTVPMPAMDVADPVPAPPPSEPPADPVQPAPPAPAASPVPVSSDQAGLIEIKKNALQELSPLVEHLDQPPEERFKTLLDMIRASDNADLVQPAHAAAQAITNEQERAKALLEIVKEVNYLTQSKDENTPPPPAP